MRQVDALTLIERGRGHDHAGRAEPALERLRIEEGFLDWMQLTVRSEPCNGGHRAPRGSKCRHQAGVYRRAIQPYRAGAAVAGVAPLFDPKEPVVPQQRAQALPRLRLSNHAASVDVKGHLAQSHASAPAGGQLGANIFGEVICEVTLVSCGSVHIAEIAFGRNLLIDRPSQHLGGWESREAKLQRS